MKDGIILSHLIEPFINSFEQQFSLSNYLFLREETKIYD